MACWNCSNLKQQYVLPQIMERRCWKPKLRPHYCNFFAGFCVCFWNPPKWWNSEAFLLQPGVRNYNIHGHHDSTTWIVIQRQVLWWQSLRGDVMEKLKQWQLFETRDILQKSKNQHRPQTGRREAKTRNSHSNFCWVFAKDWRFSGPFLKNHRVHEHFHEACCERHCEKSSARHTKRNRTKRICTSFLSVHAN